MSSLSFALAHAHKLTKDTPHSQNVAFYARSQLTMASDNTISASMPRANASTSEDKHAFFSSWPRELRDQIYDLLIIEKEEAFMDTWYKMRSRVLKARLLSNRFKEEYDERCPINKHLQIFEHYCTIDAPSLKLEGPVPPQATRATSLQYYLLWCDDEPGSDAIPGNGVSVVMHWRHYEHQIGWHIKAFPRLKQFEIVISCGSLTCAQAITARRVTYGAWGSTPAHPRVSLLRPVYDSELVQESEPYPSAFFEGRETMATWSRRDGWKVDEEVTEKCRQEEAKWLSSKLPKGEILSSLKIS
jgi:hypothetical protein